MKVAFNGFGRIGRLLFRILEEDSSFEIVAINNMSTSEQTAHLLKYDSVHGSYKKDNITFDEENIIVDGRKIKVFSEKDPINLPWKQLNVDLVLECSGKFNSLEYASRHIVAGAKRVLVSAPCKGDVKTIVYGVNENVIDGSEKIISAASCTTNCLAPVVDVLDKEFGIVKGYMTTVHAYTNDQAVLDSTHKKGIESRRGRAAAENIIPTSTGAAEAIGLVIPELEGRLKGSAMRVPVYDGSVVDLVLELDRKVSVPLINNAYIAAKSEILDATYDPIVSSDVIGDSHGGVVDLSLTDVLDVDGKQLVKVIGWYDNEMGYSYQMVRTAKYFGNLDK
jgi:glyceraldehyde 3-phosphate dehydrogenase